MHNIEITHRKLLCLSLGEVFVLFGQATQPERRFAKTSCIILVGIYLAVAILLQIILILAFWPQGSNKPENVRLILFTVSVTKEQGLLTVVLLSGGVGGMIHSLRSYMAYVGNRKFITSWVWWYLLRPFEGAVLAAVFYLVIRGGLMGGTTQNGVGPYGIAGVSALVGMFSQQATEKLKDVFETVFTRANTDDDADKIPAKHRPKVTEAEPDFLVVGNPIDEIVLRGRNLSEEITLHVGGAQRDFVVASAEEIRVPLEEGDVATEGHLEISVQGSHPTAKPETFKVPVRTG